MKGFNVLTAGRVVFLLAVFAFSVSAEEALFHNLNGAAGGKDLAGLKVEGSGFGQNQNVSGEGSGNGHFTSVGFLFPVKGDFYPGVYFTLGTVTETRMLKGFDFIGGGWWGGMYDSEDDKWPKYFGFCLGLGYILGYDYSPVDNLHILIGSSVGGYFEFWRNIINQWNWIDGSESDGFWMDEDYTSTYIFNILSPFIKIQYSYFEIAYRGLVGYYYVNPHLDSVPKEYEKNASGFDWTRHLLTIGFCFGRNK